MVAEITELYLQSSLLEAVMSGGVDYTNHCYASILQNFIVVDCPVRQ
jgi:hypothetical protein